ncbi:unnamed protein product [Heterobilharzia americana]|nr:unnamed protein product [Heterobilharzia americana]
MVSLGNHWKRFISACTTPSANATIGSGSVTSSAGIVSNAGSAAAAGAGGTPSTQNSLQKSPVEWQCLNETVNTLLKGCPVSRLAILDHLAPLYVEYFVTWWQINSTSSSNRPQETGNATVRNLSYESQNLNKAEVVLRDLLKTIHELIIQDGTSDHFFAAVCSWCLVLIRPVCTAAPTQLLSNLMDLLRSPNRHSDNAKLSSTSARNIHGTRLTDRVALAKSKLKNALNTDNSAATTSDNKSNNNKGVNYQRTGKHKSDHQLIIVSDSDSSSNSTSDEDNEEDVDEGEVASEDIQMASDSIHNTGNNETGESKPSFTNLDNRDQTTDIKSSSNKRNGQIRFGVGKLDSSSGLPIKGDSVSDHTVNLDLSPTSAVNQQILGLWVKCPVVVDLLNITCDCLLGSNIRLSSVQALLACSTVPIWDTSLDNPKNCYSLANSVLPHWIIIWLLYQATREINLLSTGIQKLNQLFDLILTSALHPFEPNVLQSTLIPDTLGGYFLNGILIPISGSLFPEFLGNWLRIKLDPIFSYAVLISNETSLEIDSTDKQGSVSQPMKLINLLLSLSLISVPIPPQFPLEQQKSSTSSHPTCDMSMDRPLRYPHPPSKGFNYGAPVPFRPPCGSNERECAPMLPRFNMPMPPRNMNPMLPTLVI